MNKGEARRERRSGGKKEGDPEIAEKADLDNRSWRGSLEHLQLGAADGSSSLGEDISALITGDDGVASDPV